MLSRITYLDTAHRAAAGRHLTQATSKWLDDQFTTAGLHEFSAVALERSRASIASVLGARPMDLGFCRNTTEGLNIAIGALRWPSGSSIVLPEREYSGLENIARRLRARDVEVIRVPVDVLGRLRPSDLEAALRQRPRAMLFSWVRQETGAKLDIDMIGEMCRRHGVISMCDAMQAVGFQSRAIDSLPIDVLSTGTHKALLGTPGAGLLWVRAEQAQQMQPASAGKETYDEAGNLRSGALRFEYGNQNFVGVAMTLAGTALLGGAGLDAIERHIRELTAQLYSSLSDQKWTMATPQENYEREHIISVQVGRNCATVSQQLERLGIRHTRQGERLRFSVHGYNSETDVEHAVRIMSSLRA